MSSENKWYNLQVWHCLIYQYFSMQENSDSDPPLKGARVGLTASKSQWVGN